MNSNFPDGITQADIDREMFSESERVSRDFYPLSKLALKLINACVYIAQRIDDND